MTIHLLHTPRTDALERWEGRQKGEIRDVSRNILSGTWRTGDRISRISSFGRLFAIHRLAGVGGVGGVEHSANVVQSRCTRCLFKLVHQKGATNYQNPNCVQNMFINKDFLYIRLSAYHYACQSLCPSRKCQ